MGEIIAYKHNLCAQAYLIDWLVCMHADKVRKWMCAEVHMKTKNFFCTTEQAANVDKVAGGRHIFEQMFDIRVLTSTYAPLSRNFCPGSDSDGKYL